MLVGVLAGSKPPVCPKCGSDDLAKLVSRFARVRSEDESIDELTDEARYGDIENDPSAMRRWVKDMGAAMDEDIGDDFEEALEDEMSGSGKRTEPADETIY